jgi:hypothetical protein
MTKAPLTHPAILALAAAFGDDCYLVDDFETAPEAARAAKWVVATDGTAAMVYRNGETICLMDTEDRSIRLGLYCRCEAAGEPDPRGTADHWVTEQMLPVWLGRGYAVDRTADQGWDDSLEMWVQNIERICTTPGELVAETVWAALQETVQLIG